MTLSNRTKISLKQLLGIIDIGVVDDILKKHNITNINNMGGDITDFIQEIVETKNNLRNHKKSTITLSPAETFKERWRDFEKCLFLDGYKIETQDDKTEIIPIEPQIDGFIAFEDELTKAINMSNLSQKDEINRCIEESAEAFKQDNFTNCLCNARIALETLIKAIAKEKYNKDETWGGALKTLKENVFLSEKEEKFMATTYTFISDGAHKPLGFNDSEYARFCRNQAIAQCYYIIKKYNQQFVESINGEPF